MIPRHRHPELAIEVFALERGKTMDIVRLAVERDRVLVGVRLLQPVLPDSKRLGDRQDAVVEQAEVRLQLGRESRGLGTNGSDFSQLQICWCCGTMIENSVLPSGFAFRCSVRKLSLPM